MKNKVISVLSALILCLTVPVTSCSSKLPPETLPPETEAVTVTETSEETEETVAVTEETEETVGPNSTAQVLDVPVEVNGQLRVEDGHLVNESGEQIQLKGMSSYGVSSIFRFFNDDVTQTLVEDWGCQVIRLAMTTRGYDNGYTYDPERFFEEVCGYTDTIIEHGAYVIIDWHILYDGDPTEYQDEAVDFFSRMSAIYGDYPNVIYEICNEPNGMSVADPEAPVDWENVIKPYAETVIDAIRENDPDNIIIVGTPNWSQDVDVVSENPISGDNIMYAFHFYAGSHGQDLMNKLQTALDNGLPVFCTEWGTSQDSGGGGVYYEETLAWMQLLDDNGISWCNWSIGGSNTESSNALKLYSNHFTVEQKIGGHWPDEMLSDSGLFVRSLILGWEFEIPEEG